MYESKDKPFRVPAGRNNPVGRRRVAKVALAVTVVDIDSCRFSHLR